MTLAELRTELQSRGFDYVTDSRLNRWLNRAQQRICDRHNWPFLETTTTGAAPLTISDVRTILSVTDTDSDATLLHEDARSIKEYDPTLAATGTPLYYYLNGSAVTTYPVSTNGLSVTYIKAPADMSSDSDSPVLPSRYHLLLVDFAACEAYKDSDNLEAFQILRGDVEEQIQEMVNALLVQGDAGTITPASGSGDW